MNKFSIAEVPEYDGSKPVLYSDIIYYNDKEKYVRGFKKILKELYVRYSLPPLYSAKDILITANTYGLIPKYQELIYVYVKKDNEDKLLKKAKRQLSSRRKYNKKATSIIYALINTITDRLFYIGSTKNSLNKRFLGHIKNGISGSKTSIVELCKCPTQIQFTVESQWIEAAKNAGYKLVNIQQC